MILPKLIDRTTECASVYSNKLLHTVPADLSPPPCTTAERPPQRMLTMDETVEARFVNGDPQAMRDLYRAHGAALFGAAFRILGDRTLAEDAVQQALLQAWRAAGRFDPNRNIAPWLVTITKRCAIDVYRKEKRHRAEELADYDAAVAAPGIETAWDVFRVRTALKQLAESEREILVLTHFTGMTHEDAAQHLEIPLGTVKSRSYRAYRKLTTLLADMEEGEQ